MTRIVNQDQVLELLTRQGQQFAVIQNPSGVFPREELVPLAAVRTETDALSAIVCDMDGTLTTTEGLCLHSLETMVRRWMPLELSESWRGLDPQQDYPHVIGNSTTRHVEYLLDTYGDTFDWQRFTQAFWEAALWISREGQDQQLKDEVQRQLKQAGCPMVILSNNIPSVLNIPSGMGRVAFAVTIYYHRYHEILNALGAESPATELKDLNTLIEPMPAVGLFLALVKGCLDVEDVRALLPLWLETLAGRGLTVPVNTPVLEILTRLTLHFREHPARLGLVTSSVDYEMRIVLKAVFREIQKQIKQWPLPVKAIRKLQKVFSDYRNLLDVRINASHSSEGRLKPHRDLYSMALQHLGVAPADFGKVLGFEDSESGTIAMRAAGIGLAMAVPFQDTSDHDLSAAACILHGGLAEAVIIHQLFIKL